MKVKVVAEFRDKYSGKRYKVGQILDISKERFEEIIKIAPLVERVEKPKKAETPAE